MNVFSDLRQVGSFLRVLRIIPNKTDRHHIIDRISIIVGVFRVKNHDFTPKNHFFSNSGGRRENCWGKSCEKSRFYAKKSYVFQFRGGGGMGVGGGGGEFLGRDISGTTFY